MTKIKQFSYCHLFRRLLCVIYTRIIVNVSRYGIYIRAIRGRKQLFQSGFAESRHVVVSSISYTLTVPTVLLCHNNIVTAWISTLYMHTHTRARPYVTNYTVLHLKSRILGDQCWPQKKKKGGLRRCIKFMYYSIPEPFTHIIYGPPRRSLWETGRIKLPWNVFEISGHFLPFINQTKYPYTITADNDNTNNTNVKVETYRWKCNDILLSRGGGKGWFQR